MTIKSGNIKKFAGYSQFESVEEFNKHAEQWLKDCKDEFTKGEIVGLKQLITFSSELPGVCNLRITTILQKIADEHLGCGISRATFKRMILKAKSLGILTVYETENKRGTQNSNLYVFSRIADPQTTYRKKLNHLNKSLNPLKTKTSKTLNIM
ncbi:hypothetical protein [Bacillus massilinigeriensis]|uniref:hypothetical protein n=1 Tax=Bacillus mediterraneensis TaxID=1805474 RepID=UPI0008F93D2E|nr:hypothetical protein [Bacillus mediterraneensis]